MNFIETIKSVGCVKPCRCQSLVFTPETPVEHMVDLRKKSAAKCSVCHGTGQIIDLAPLLAKPRELEKIISHAFSYHDEPFHKIWDIATAEITFVIGPQRAHSLVYEVARQLGGSAVVCASELKVVRMVDERGDSTTGQKHIYRLSTPIPDNATVLFVTDRVNTEEIYNMTSSEHRPCVPTPVGVKPLPYILCLVSDREELEISGDGGLGREYLVSRKFKVISLHQEK